MSLSGLGSKLCCLEPPQRPQLSMCVCWDPSGHWLQWWMVYPCRQSPPCIQGEDNGLPPFHSSSPWDVTPSSAPVTSNDNFQGAELSGYFFRSPHARYQPVFILFQEKDSCLCLLLFILFRDTKSLTWWKIFLTSPTSETGFKILRIFKSVCFPARVFSIESWF